MAPASGPGDPRNPPVVTPAPHGDLYLAASLRPGRAALPPPSPRRSALLRRLTALGEDLRAVPGVVSATAFRGVLLAPPSGVLERRLRHALPGAPPGPWKPPRSAPKWPSS